MEKQSMTDNGALDETNDDLVNNHTNTVDTVNSRTATITETSDLGTETKVRKHADETGTAKPSDIVAGEIEEAPTSMTVVDSDIEQSVKDKDDSHLIQIKASNSEIQRRISAFIERKQNDVDENNRQEFCGVFPAMEVAEDSCARTESVFVPRAGGKSHMKVSRVVNSYGPQTRALASGQEVSPSKPKVKEEASTDGMEERLSNIETHLKMKGSSKSDMFSRLKVLEERVLFLESLSPEYFKSGPPALKRQRTAGSSSSLAHKEMTLSEIEEKMKALRETLLKKTNTS